jgi:hypothetical protein
MHSTISLLLCAHPQEAGFYFQVTLGVRAKGVRLRAKGVRLIFVTYGLKVMR